MPVAAVPLAAMSFFVAKAAFRQPTPVVWGTSFAVWLIVAAIYIPTHLYIREWETGAGHFLYSKPLDRFRLWWIWLLVGLVTLTSVGIVLFGVTDALSRIYFGGVLFEIDRELIIYFSLIATVMIFCLSSFFSAIFKKQLNSIIATILAIILALVLYEVKFYLPDRANALIEFHQKGGFNLFGMYSFSSSINHSLIRILILCPVMLFCSLALFAKTDVWRGSRTAVVQAYGLSGIVALVPILLGFAQLKAGMRISDVDRRSLYDNRFDVEGAAEDGTNILLKTRAKDLVALDLSSKEIYNLPGGWEYSYRPALKGERILMTEEYSGMLSDIYDSVFGKRPGIFPIRIVLHDRHGGWKKNLYTSRWLSSRHRFGGARAYWSVDGTYIALVKWPYEKRGEDGFIEILDQDGNQFGKHIVPLIGGETIRVVGWDYDSRFYFGRPNPGPLTYWRISPNNLAPEEIPRLSETGFIFDPVSPDGRWMLTLRENDQGDHGYWIYDIAGDALHYVGKEAGRHTWSPDGRYLAYRAQTDPPDGEESPRRDSYSRLLLHKLETKKTISVSPKPFYDLSLYSWSPSGKYLLIGYSIRETTSNGEKKADARTKWKWTTSILSMDTLQITPISHRTATLYYYYQDARLPWISDDRLMWRGKNKLIVTEHEGSNSQELFRIEDGRFYLYGEEQS
jgi:hypothetical protein